MLIYASSCPDYFAVHGEAFVRSAEKQGYQVKVDLVERNDYDDARVYAAALRFLRLPELLDEHFRVLVLDIDSIVNRIAPVSSEWDMALFLRPWLTSEEKKVMLSASYWTARAKPFAEHLRNQFSTQSKWGADQRYAFRTFKAMGDKFNIGKLDQDFISYDFRDDAPIWTAKGPARKDNPKYLERRAAYA